MADSGQIGCLRGEFVEHSVCRDESIETPYLSIAAYGAACPVVPANVLNGDGIRLGGRSSRAKCIGEGLSICPVRGPFGGSAGVARLEICGQIRILGNDSPELVAGVYAWMIW
ncbi:hypothetical protein [Nocardia nova]|uniref:hypothetical protein n=1 Tax=Nocardia nova TaxID=37330 RepID=UPI0033DCAEFE